MTATVEATIGRDDVAGGGTTRTAARTAGMIALTGVVLAAVGSVFNQVVVDVDMFAAMETSSADERAQLLTAVAADQTPLVVGFVIWMVGFPLIALASVLLARLGRPSTLTFAVSRTSTASIGAIIVFLSMFLAFPVVIAPAHVAGEDVSTLAHTIGFMATTVDWVVTAIVLGLAPIGAVWAGRRSWTPRWLVGLAGITAAATVMELAGLVADNRDLAFPIVPIGLLLVAAAGVCAMRSESV
jgi:hypothetical protein